MTSRMAWMLSIAAALTATLATFVSMSTLSLERTVLISVIAVMAIVALSRSMPKIHIALCGFTIYFLLITPNVWSPIMVGLLVLAAGFQLAADRRRDITLGQLKPTWIASASAAAITMAFAGATLGPFTQSSGGASFQNGPPTAPDAGAAPANGPPSSGGGNALSRFLERVFGSLGDWTGLSGQDGSEQGQGDPIEAVGPPDADRDINWLRIMILTLIVLLVASLLWWAWRRWKGRHIESSVDGDWAVRSFDETGRRIARERRVSEDPASYGDGIESSASAGRLARAGLLVADRLYRPSGRAQTASEEAALRSELDGLADLPSAPKPPRRRPSAKRAAVLVVAILVAAGGGFAAWSSWSGGAESATHSMLAAPATDADGYRWVLCALGLDDESPREPGEVRGFSDVSGSLAVTESFGLYSNRIFVAGGGHPLVYNSVGGDEAEWVPWSSGAAFPIDMSHLRSVGNVVEAFDLPDGGVRVDGSDGGSYVSWQQPNRLAAQAELVGFGAGAGDLTQLLSSSAHRIEVWSSVDGVVERVRVTLQEFEQTSIELRFVESVPVVQRPGIDGQSSLNLFGDCPRSQEEAVAAGWLGFESYDATVNTIADLPVDEEGRAYDIDWVYAVDPVESTEVGHIIFDEGSASFFDPYTLLYGDPSGVDIDLETDTPLPMSVSRLDAVSDYTYGVGLRFDREGHAVERWEAASMECEFFTSLAVGTSTLGVWPNLSEEAFYSDWFAPSVEIVGDDSWVGYAGEADVCLDVYVGYGSGRVQSILVRDSGVPWRIIAPDGAPPANVVDAELRFQECVDGVRPVGIYGSCLEP